LQKVSIVCELDATLPLIWGDPDLIKQVVMNLLVNAQQAIEGSGVVTVRTRLCADAGHLQDEPQPQAMVELTVSDSGCGIAAANLERIFEPFYTSKEPGKGTGLGLSVSHGIVRTHHGRIQVESILGQGSTFHVFLPIEAPSSKNAPTSNWSNM
jgi:signal transduction histidine kinase